MYLWLPSPIKNNNTDFDFFSPLQRSNRIFGGSNDLFKTPTFDQVRYLSVIDSLIGQLICKWDACIYKWLIDSLVSWLTELSLSGGAGTGHHMAHSKACAPSSTPGTFSQTHPLPQGSLQQAASSPPAKRQGPRRRALVSLTLKAVTLRTRPLVTAPTRPFTFLQVQVLTAWCGNSPDSVHLRL